MIFQKLSKKKLHLLKTISHYTDENAAIDASIINSGYNKHNSILEKKYKYVKQNRR